MFTGKKRKKFWQIDEKLYWLVIDVIVGSSMIDIIFQGILHANTGERLSYAAGEDMEQEIKEQLATNARFRRDFLYTMMKEGKHTILKYLDKETENRYGKEAAKVRAVPVEDIQKTKLLDDEKRGEVNIGVLWGAFTHPDMEGAWVDGLANVLVYYGNTSIRDLAMFVSSEKQAWGEVEKQKGILDSERNDWAEARRVLRLKNKKLESEKQKLEKDLQGIEQLKCQLFSLQSKLAEYENTDFALLKKEHERVQSELRDASQMLADAFRSDKNLSDTITQLREEMTVLRHDNKLKDEEIASLYKWIENETGGPVEVEKPEVSVLRGARVMYCGGQESLEPNYREFIEGKGGNFIYHDGTVDGAINGFRQAVENADVVFCPVDGISHAAFGQIKLACRKKKVPFRILRSSGLSEFRNTVAQIEKVGGIYD